MGGKTLTVFFLAILLLGITTRAEAVLIILDSYDNPVLDGDGNPYTLEDHAFADLVYSFTPGTGGRDAAHSDTNNALGAPDDISLSLGNGGLLTLQFTDNYLTTSGDSDLDLWIFEKGGAIEATDVYIRTSLEESWIAVGRAGGATKGIDIDAFSGVVSGGLYSYVLLVDVEFGDMSSGWPSSGADIDAIGAISSIAVDAPDPEPGPEPGPTSIPEPSTMLLLVAGLFGLAVYRARFEPSI